MGGFSKKNIYSIGGGFKDVCWKIVTPKLWGEMVHVLTNIFQNASDEWSKHQLDS